MTTPIRTWLETDQEPPNLYVLVDRPLFDPDRQRLEESIGQVYGELLKYQNHQDPRVVKRVVYLQRQLGRFAAMVANPAKMRAHQREMLERLRVDFAKVAHALPSTARIEAWLTDRYHVHPAVVQRLSHLLTSTEPETLEAGLLNTLQLPPLDSTSDSGSVEVVLLEDDRADGQAAASGSEEDDEEAFRRLIERLNLPQHPAIHRRPTHPAPKFSQFFRLPSLRRRTWVGLTLAAAVLVFVAGRLFLSSRGPAPGKPGDEHATSEEDGSIRGRTPDGRPFVDFVARFEGYDDAEKAVRVTANRGPYSEARVRLPQATRQDFADYWEGDTVAVMAVDSPPSSQGVLEGIRVVRLDDRASEVTASGRRLPLSSATIMRQGQLREVVGHEGEIHLRIAWTQADCDLEVFTGDYSFEREIADYRSEADSDSRRGDRVTVEVKRKRPDPAQVRFRLASAAPLGELVSMRRVVDGRSIAEARVGRLRSEDDFDGRPRLEGLAKMLRIHPRANDRVQFPAEIASSESSALVLRVRVPDAAVPRFARIHLAPNAPAPPSAGMRVEIDAVVSGDSTFRQLELIEARLTTSGQPAPVAPVAGMPAGVDPMAKNRVAASPAGSPREPTADEEKLRSRWLQMKADPLKHLGQEFELLGTAQYSFTSSLRITRLFGVDDAVNVNYYQDHTTPSASPLVPGGREMRFGVRVSGGTLENPELVLVWRAERDGASGKTEFSLPPALKELFSGDVQALRARWDAIAQDPSKHLGKRLTVIGTATSFRERERSSPSFRSSRQALPGAVGPTVPSAETCSRLTFETPFGRCLLEYYGDSFEIQSSLRSLCSTSGGGATVCEVMVVGANGAQPRFALLSARRAGVSPTRADVAPGPVLCVSSPPRRVIDTGGTLAKSIAWSPDGKRLAATFAGRPGPPAPASVLGRKPALTAGASAAMWDVMTGEEIRTFVERDAGPAESVAWSADGRELATAHADGVRVWDAETGKRLRVVFKGTLREPPLGLAWHPDDSLLAASTSRGPLYLSPADKSFRPRGAAAQLPVRSKPGVWGPVKAAAWNPKRRELATICDVDFSEGLVCSWDVTNLGQMRLVRLLLPGYVSSNARTFLLQLVRQGLAGADVVERAVQLEDSRCASVAWSPDGLSLATGGHYVQIWDCSRPQTTLRRRKLRDTLSSSEPFCFLTWESSGQWLAAYQEGQVQMWDAEREEPVGRYPLEAPPRIVAWSPKWDRMALAGNTGLIEVHDVVAPEPKPAAKEGGPAPDPGSSPPKT